MTKIEELRKKIDLLDTQLLELLHNRLSVVKDIDKVKKKLGLKPLDINRWNQILERELIHADSLGLRREFIKKILNTIHEEALLIQK
ncbi:MAG: chorismate mutase [Candidatus Roizmanbacteria bacterium]|nr:chorismate mutase [Candidatus Roizmanbacteria bacterium]